jgi:hypothetical protein
MPNNVILKLKEAMENRDLDKILEIREKLFKECEIEDIHFSDLGSVQELVAELSEQG